MLRNRIIPVLLLSNESLVKTRSFRNAVYVGDPCNTVRIFNELEVDELTFLDIDATPNGTGPNFSLLKDIADECFMPLSYGGGVTTVEQAAKLFDIGFEKVVINSATFDRPELVPSLAKRFGSQAIVGAIDVGRSRLGGLSVRSHSGRIRRSGTAGERALALQSSGVGEILLTCIDREGSWNGFDVPLLREICDCVTVPVIAHGGAGCVGDIGTAIVAGGASAVALGSMVVFQKKDMGVLVNFPEKGLIETILSQHHEERAR